MVCSKIVVDNISQSLSVFLVTPNVPDLPYFLCTALTIFENRKWLGRKIVRLSRLLNV